MKVKKLVSLLVDPINVETTSGLIVVIHPSGKVVGSKNYKKSVSKIRCKKLGDFFLAKEKFEDPEKIPDPEEGVLYIIPKFVFDLMEDSNRNDIITLGKLTISASGTSYYKGFITR